MNNRYRLSSKAEIDLAETWLYIARDDPSAADRLIDSLRQAFKRLAQFPMLGEARPSFGEGIRLSSFRSYAIYYQPEQEGVHILRVIHGARDFRSLVQD